VPAGEAPSSRARQASTAWRVRWSGSRWELLERGRVHGELDRVGRVRVEHAGAEHDASRRRGGRRQQDRSRAQEQVVRDPELVETGVFGGGGQLDEGR
jgi:hypothetical protein